ncbi:hypothetical protein AnigIFM63326_011281 [Aspergillus niger]|nr:hypothetical protein AnigIFM63326_011281 [Aspergillus niger]
MTTLWEVIDFKVQTTAQNNTSDSIFANGQMQAKVIVSIRAIIAATGANYQFTEAELKSIKLIDYYSMSELTGKWFYSFTENGYAHALPGAGAPVEPIADGTQSINFWVSSTGIEYKNIAAKISQPGEGQSTIITTTGGSFNSMVTLRAIQQTIYTTSNVTFTREDTATGKWQKQTAFGSSTHNWDQDNYYLSSNVYPFLKVDRHGVDMTGSQNGVASTSDMKDSFAYLKVGSNDISMFYMFDMEVESTVRRGLSTWNSSSTVDRLATIKINQRGNTLCLTRLRFYHGYVTWFPNWEEDTWFTIYDLYGNHGHFSVKQRGQNTISISSLNSTSLAESTAIERTAKI